MTEQADLMAYDDMCARIYVDKRMPPGTRELALALAWANLRDPERDREQPGKGAFRRAGHLLGREKFSNRWRNKALWADDAPRYEPPARDGWHTGSCEGPRLRPYRPRGMSGYGVAVLSLRQDGRDSVCGADANTRVVERDLVTGWHRTHWFCRRHVDQAKRVEEQIARAGDPPPPIPNTGGLLPCYFKPEAVEKLYRWANPRWEPPYYGICADDWPVPGQQVVPRRPRLSLVVDSVDSEAS